MKDARFKELLNLHLDHRLSEAEAAELEGAMREDPARRKMVRDYESMQSACAALFARAESLAPSSDPLRRALRQAEDRMDNPRPLRDAWGWPTWGVTGGLAACVALVVARLSQPAVGTAASPASSPAPDGAALAAATATAPAAVAVASRRAVALPNQITFAALGLNPGGANADAASRWILLADEPAVYATIEQANAAGESLQAWAPPAQSALPARHFADHPIRAWEQSGQGAFQLETAAYRFER